MKLVKTANGKQKIRMTQQEWEKIGSDHGWLEKEAKWGKKDVVNPKEKGKWKGYTQEELKSKLSKAKERQKKRERDRQTEKERERQREFFIFYPTLYFLNLEKKKKTVKKGNNDIYMKLWIKRMN